VNVSSCLDISKLNSLLWRRDETCRLQCCRRWNTRVRV